MLIISKIWMVLARGITDKSPNFPTTKHSCYTVVDMNSIKNIHAHALFLIQTVPYIDSSNTIIILSP